MSSPSMAWSNYKVVMLPMEAEKRGKNGAAGEGKPRGLCGEAVNPR